MDMTNIGVVQALGIALLGILVVFLVLIILMGAITLQNVIIAKLEESKKAPAAATAIPEAPAPAAAPAKLAKGSCGGVMLHDVPDATAAMVMAIVADELQTSLNELRFISIQEVK